MRKAVTTHLKKYDIFSNVFQIPNRLRHVTRLSRHSIMLSGWWMNGKAFTILDPRSFVGIFSDYGCQNTEKSASLTGSGIQTFLEGEENQNTKKNPKVTYSVAL